MANVTSMDSPTKTAPKPPRKPIEEPEEQQQTPRQDSRLPKIGDLAAGTNEEYLESIKDEQWKNLTCYVYRTAPSIDRQAAGKEISIDRIGAKFTMRDIVNRHGSGRYKFILSYAPPNGGQWIRVRQWYETILDMEKPPRVPFGEWLDNPANKDWEWARPLLRAEQVEREQQAAEKIAGKSQQPQTSPVEQLKETMELAKTMLPADSSQAILLKLLEQSGPANMLTMAEKLATLRQPEKSDNAIVVLLLEHLLKRENPAAADPLESTAKLMTGFQGLFEKMGMMKNAGEAAPAKMDTSALIVQGVGDVLGKAIEQFGPYVPAVLEVVRHVKDRDLQIAQVAAARGMNPAAPYQFVGSPQVPAAPVAHNPAPIAAAQPTPAENAPMTPQVFFEKHQALLNEMFPQLKDWFNNENGYYVADWIIDRKGHDAYNAIRKDASVDLLMQISMAVPQLREIFQPAQDAREFFEELLCDPDNRPEEAEEPVTEVQQ